jgi:hypothetical protein
LESSSKDCHSYGCHGSLTELFGCHGSLTELFGFHGSMTELFGPRLKKKVEF